MMKENRWFTKTGKAKRFSSDVKEWKTWADANKANFLSGNSIQLVSNLRYKYPQLTLTEATNLMVFLVGCYSNATQYGHGHINGGLFRAERYEAGKIVSQSLNDKPFDIQKLQLVEN